jgi:Zn-dependent peptidase ImmA (M78 family)
MRVRHDENGVPIANNQRIEELAEYFLSRTAPRALAAPCAVPIPELVTQLSASKFCTFGFDEDLGEDSDGKKCLGYYSLSRKHIAINRTLTRKDPRFSFTFAHELGHFYLHSRVNPSIISKGNAGEIRDTSADIMTFRVVGTRPRSLLEWQANRFASALLVPRKTLPHALDVVQRSLGITRRGHIYVDHQPQNQRDYRKTLLLLSDRYQVSQSVVKYRLRDAGHLREHSSFAPLSMGHAVQDLLTEIFR